MKMLSIIICSRTQNISENLSENIKNTIGCEYELIVIDNSENKYSIFEAYNLGIVKSKGEYLCMMHDDVLLHTIAWGGIVNTIFKDDNEIGLIGVAGATIKTKSPSAWWDCPENQRVMNIIQHFPNQTTEEWNCGFGYRSVIKVAAIDGVFMAMRRDNQICFDSTMHGFHNYDLNISFEYIKKGYKIVVTNEVLLEHFSLGIVNEAWFRSTYALHKKYRKLLPLGKCEKANCNKLEVINAKHFIEESLKYGLHTIAIAVWMQLFCLNPITQYHYSFWKRIIKEKLC